MSQKLQIAVVEDEPAEQELLGGYIRRFSRESQQEIAVTMYPDGTDLLSGFQSQFDIILMDIQMKNMSGIEAAQRIREKDTEVILIFITNMAQYAIRGYSVGAKNFILKPVSYFAFCEELRSAVAAMQKKAGKAVMLRTEEGMIKLFPEELFYAETVGRKIVLHTKKGDLGMSCGLKELETCLSDDRFFRCHSSYLVNLYHVDGVVAAGVLVQGKEIPLSRHRKKDFEEALIRIFDEI